MSTLLGGRDSPKGWSCLSDRERQVVDLIVDAWGVKEIAYVLDLTPGTVTQYLANIYRKLGISGRAELARWATKQPKRVA